MRIINKQEPGGYLELFTFLVQEFNVQTFFIGHHMSSEIF